MRDMAEALDSPKNPEELWITDVAEHRLLMQGDIVITEGGPVCVATHACSMRRGIAYHKTQVVAPIRDESTRWQGHYDWMPLPEAPIPDLTSPAACIREFQSTSTDHLQSGRRVSAMTPTGIQLFQQRMVHHLSRVKLDLIELEEQSAHIIAEVDLHDEWVTQLGQGAESEFYRFLDANDRKLREELKSPYTRSAVIQTVRQEIRSR